MPLGDDDEGLVPLVTSKTEDTDCEDGGMALPIVLVLAVIVGIGVWNSVFGEAGDARAQQPERAVYETTLSQGAPRS